MIMYSRQNFTNNLREKLFRPLVLVVLDINVTKMHIQSL